MKGRGGMSWRKEKESRFLTGGGDCPGLNAVIRAVTKKAIYEQAWKSSVSRTVLKGWSGIDIGN